MSARLLVGTVRARHGARHTVVTADGATHELILKGSERPLVGGDVIGMVDLTVASPEMTLVRDVAGEILQGATMFSMGGRPEVTAMMLTRLLEGTGPAMVRPGVGGIIERTPDVSDPDLRWVIDLVGPEARQLGLALNVIDPVALAQAPWSDDLFRQELLPADVVGGAGGMGDLKRLMRAGFSPTCRRTFQDLSARDGGAQRVVSSVDFVMPYSPFATGHSFCSSMGGGWRSEVPRASLTLSQSRRLSAFREVSFAFVQRYMGRGRGEAALRRHGDETFADAAALIAYVQLGGDREHVQDRIRVARTYAELRESGVARWNGSGEPPPVTHKGLRSLLPTLGHLDVSCADDVFKHASSVATSCAPTTRRRFEAAVSSAQPHDVFVDLGDLSGTDLDHVGAAYRADLGQAVESLGGYARGVERLARFGLYTTPHGLEPVFDRLVADHGYAWSSARDRAVDDALVVASDDHEERMEPIPSF